MKKVVTLEILFSSLFSTIGYGLGFFIPSNYGLNMIISLIICLVVGLTFDNVISSIIYSKYVQKNNKRRYICFAIIVVVFFLVWHLSSEMFAHSLLGDVTLEYAFVIGTALFSLFVSVISELIKRKKIRKKYGIGDLGYFFNKDEIDYFETKVNNVITGEYDYDLSVKTKYGTYVGIKKDDQIFFNGIPYAKAPIDDLRFMPPEHLSRSEKVFEAYYKGPSEIQPNSKHNILNNHVQSEDCLYLNVITNSLDSNAKKPVIVYFHGGDGRYGGSANPFCSLDNISFKLKDVVFVSFNYRIGLFGVVDFSERFNDYSLKDTNCLSIADQISALNYIKENIHLFGGDSDNVTLMGDSIGASYINVLCTCQSAKGLFKRVFMVGGSMYDMAYDITLSKKLGNAIVDELGITTIGGLRSISSQELRKIYDKYYLLIEAAPFSSKYVSKDMMKKIENGFCKDIDFIIGFGSGELSGWVGMTTGEVELKNAVDDYYNNLMKIIDKNKRYLLDKIMESYRKNANSEKEAKTNLLSDLQYKASMITTCSKLARGGSNVYCFYWNETSHVDKFNSNVISIVSTILGNSKFAESMGYIISSDYTEIFEAFIHKFVNGEKPILLRNEIKGIDQIIWKKYSDRSENILVIGDNEISNETDIISKEIKAIQEMIDERV